MKKHVFALSLVLMMGSYSFFTHATSPVIDNVKSTAPIAATETAPEQKTQPQGSATAANPKSDTSGAEEKQKGIIDTSYREVQALALLKNPAQWVGEKISFTGTFVSFSPYALDYKGALRESKDYIAFLVQRPDVGQHVIPLSELKLIYPRKKADKVMDIESGDKIIVHGKVFSAALGDPWVDVEEVILLKKSPENAAKAKKTPKKGHEELE